MNQEQYEQAKAVLEAELAKALEEAIPDERKKERLTFALSEIDSKLNANAEEA